jgi:hypothetical protein
MLSLERKTTKPLAGVTTSPSVKSWILMLLIVYFEPKSIITHPSFKMLEVISNGVNVALHKSVQNSGVNTYILDTSKTPSLSQTHTISTGNYTTKPLAGVTTSPSVKSWILMLLIVYFEPKSIITHPSFKML